MNEVPWKYKDVMDNRATWVIRLYGATQYHEYQIYESIMPRTKPLGLRARYLFQAAILQRCNDVLIAYMYTEVHT